ncbi:MAG TPA: diguanylate cyclase [Burkholderiaceae bacterium]|nr:diguanylate cyclase [Burkholderiaceae bacterium]
MDIFARIAQQVAAVGMPLYAVSVTAAARIDTPVLLFLHWHGFRRETPLRLPGVPLMPQPVPGSALQLNERWHAFEAIDEAMLDAGWQLGAWDVERVERRGCSRAGASAREAHECRQAFGDYPDADTHLLAEAPDRPDLMRLASDTGYVRWQFRPVKGGLWPANGDDATLDAEGGGEPPGPGRPSKPGRADHARQSRICYRLGRGERLVVIGSS